MPFFAHLVNLLVPFFIFISDMKSQSFAKTFCDKYYISQMGKAKVLEKIK